MLQPRPVSQGQPVPVGSTLRERNLLPLGLADELRAARRGRGLSLRQAARAAGITAGYLSRLGRGLRAPRVGLAVRLARVLELDDDLADALIEAAVDPYGAAVR